MWGLGPSSCHISVKKRWLFKLIIQPEGHPSPSLATLAIKPNNCFQRWWTFMNMHLNLFLAKLLTWLLLFSFFYPSMEGLKCIKQSKLSREYYAFGCRCRPCYLCAYVAKRCLPKAHLQLDNGAEQAIEQPELQEKQWFLTSEEMTHSRRGIPRTHMTLFTLNNSIHFFADTASMWRALQKDFKGCL